VYYVEA